ncbi:hypothetical protein K0M31_003865 [Melipona bicolor]|uniref:Uncharacterized protein n=1 Tax=Melipona bicolor TaxID=60889 RepID=A0AA40KNV9_9HYME|nr:hypothetical protein K0M31_003865 [Melipona bicolor]
MAEQRTEEPSWGSGSKNRQLERPSCGGNGSGETGSDRLAGTRRRGRGERGRWQLMRGKSSERREKASRYQRKKTHPDGVLRSRFLGVLLSSDHFHVPLRALQCHLDSPPISRSPAVVITNLIHCVAI